MSHVLKLHICTVFIGGRKGMVVGENISKYVYRVGCGQPAKKEEVNRTSATIGYFPRGQCASDLDPK